MRQFPCLRKSTLTLFPPKIDLYGDFYLGEYPWHPALEGVDAWSSPENGWRSTAVPARPTVATYTCERGGYDYSIDRTVSVEIPAPWLADAMGLRMTNGRSPIYVDGSGREIFYDPSVQEAGPAAALIDRDAFLQLLEREKLSAVWVIAGEKSVYGGRDPGQGFGGRMLHTALYRLGSDGFDRYFHDDWNRPSKGQLAEFYGEEAPPSNVRRKGRGPVKASTKRRGRTRSGSGRSAAKRRSKRSRPTDKS